MFSDSSLPSPADLNRGTHGLPLGASIQIESTQDNTGFHREIVYPLAFNAVPASHAAASPHDDSLSALVGYDVVEAADPPHFDSVDHTSVVNITNVNDVSHEASLDEAPQCSAVDAFPRTAVDTVRPSSDSTLCEVASANPAQQACESSAVVANFSILDAAQPASVSLLTLVCLCCSV